MLSSRWNEGTAGFPEFPPPRFFLLCPPVPPSSRPSVHPSLAATGCIVRLRRPLIRVLNSLIILFIPIIIIIIIMYEKKRERVSDSQFVRQPVKQGNEEAHRRYEARRTPESVTCEELAHVEHVEFPSKSNTPCSLNA